MRIFLVGHRGTGKSSLLKRIKNDFDFYPLLQKFKDSFFDLDKEIEKKFGNLETLFSEKGEIKFRQIEIEVLSEITDSNPFVFCVLGAGFDVSQLKSDDCVGWIRRESDKSGRIFLNRPRLNAEISALDEYQFRFQSREPYFRKIANFVYTLPEGRVISSEIERKLLNDIWKRIFDDQLIKADPVNIANVGIENLAPDQLSQKSTESFLEVRSDVWTESDILFYKNELAKFQKIYSLRNSPSPGNLNIDFSQWAYLDWDIQYGNCLWENVDFQKIIFSTHEENIFSAIKLLDSAMINDAFANGQINLKLCPLVNSWQELITGYNWWKQDPEKRNFLPRSVNGKWNWFRLWMKGKQKLNFVRQGPAEITDQPTFFSWESVRTKTERFAAVLGSPVNQSYSPAFHRDYFAKNNISFYSVDVTRQEFPVAIEFLRELGLRFAAVTAPLKRSAFLVCESLSEPEKSLESVNTLIWNPEKNFWTGKNTDFDAFQQSYFQQVSNLHKDCVVWGGGGTTNIMRSALPEAKFVKAREGLSEDTKISSPDTLIWASARSQETKWPPEKWQPKIIFDLNYHENSMGLEYAEKHKCDYISGYKMFELQALQQQKIWDSFL